MTKGEPFQHAPQPAAELEAAEPRAENLRQAAKNANLQDVFLNHLRREKTPVTMFLVKGVKLQGIVTWFDNFSILLRRDGQSQLVYKHAISTIMPGQPVDAEQFGSGRGWRAQAAPAAGRVPQPRARCRSAGDDVPGQRRDAAGPDRRL